MICCVNYSPRGFSNNNIDQEYYYNINSTSVGPARPIGSRSSIELEPPALSGELSGNQNKSPFFGMIWKLDCFVVVLEIHSWSEHCY